MTLQVIILVIVSALLHAGWNLLAKHQRSQISFFSRMLLIVLLVGLGPGIISEIYSRSIPPLSWLCMIGSAVCLSIYMYGLGKAYGRSDFTIVYPVVRGLPVLLTGLFDVLRAHLPTFAGWIGMLCVVSGCMLAPQKSFKKVRMRRYLNSGVFWMLLSALGSVGYSVLDKIAQENVTAGAGSAFRYSYFLYALWCVAYRLLIGLQKVTDEERGRDPGWKFPALAAFCTYLSYSLILWAYQMVEKVSYVVAFRQLSIIFGVVAAFLIFKERGLSTRLTAAFLLAGGLVIISFWG